jgi:anti-sigma factor RsiW
MRCRDVEGILEELGGVEPLPAVRRHLAECAACRAYAQDWKLVHAGFRALAQEPLPEASVGFTARLLRRVEEASRAVDPAREFLEQAGRRVVYAGLLLMVAVLFALLAPAWSLLRGWSAAELFPTPQVQAAESDPIFADEASNNASLPLGARNQPGPEGAQEKQK